MGYRKENSPQTSGASLESANSPDRYRFSPAWDLCVPFSIAAIPAILFTLLGFVTQGLDKPGVQAALWVIVVMLVLQTLGIIAMAVVILMRFGIAFQQLALRTSGRPASWRKGTLLCAIVLILLFDILTNVSAAFAGAGTLLIPAAAAFLGYLFCIRLAFAQLE